MRCPATATRMEALFFVLLLIRGDVTNPEAKPMVTFLSYLTTPSGFPKMRSASSPRLQLNKVSCLHVPSRMFYYLLRLIIVLFSGFT